MAGRREESNSCRDSFSPSTFKDPEKVMVDASNVDNVPLNSKISHEINASLLLQYFKNRSKQYHDCPHKRSILIMTFIIS